MTYLTPTRIFLITVDFLNFFGTFTNLSTCMYICWCNNMTYLSANCAYTYIIRQTVLPLPKTEPSFWLTINVIGSGISRVSICWLKGLPMIIVDCRLVPSAFWLDQSLQFWKSILGWFLSYLSCGISKQKTSLLPTM